MVECPECGARNPDAAGQCTVCAARFCADESALLAGGTDRAPAADVESGASRSGDHPSEAGPDPTAADDWLAQLLAATPDETVLPEIPERPPGTGQEPDLPTWLRDLEPDGVVEHEAHSAGLGGDADRRALPIEAGAPPEAAGEQILAGEILGDGGGDAPAPTDLPGKAEEAAHTGEGALPAPQDASESAALELGAVLAAEAVAADALGLADTLSVGAMDVEGGARGHDELGTGIDLPLGGLPLGSGAPGLPGSVPSLTDADVLEQRARRLERFVAAPSTSWLVGERRPGAGGLELVARVLVPLVLVAVVVLAVALPPDSRRLLPAVSLPNGYPAGPARMHDTLRRVGAGEEVMLAFEYGPAQADEMGLIAGPVVRQLGAQGARMSIVTTRPDGLVAARAVLRDAVSGGTMTAGEADRIVASGAYRPGDAVGVAHLLQRDGQPDLIVVIAARIGPLRRWIEQARAVGTPASVVAATSAAIEGVAASYLADEPELLAGLVSGVSGAAYYDRIANGSSDGPAAERLDALAAGNGAVILLVIVGAAVAGVPAAAGKRGTRR